jgi:hypothetical protein
MEDVGVGSGWLMVEKSPDGHVTADHSPLPIVLGGNK